MQKALKKAEKTLLEEFGVKTKEELKTKLNPQAKADEPNEDVIKLRKELTEMKALNVCKDEEIKKEYQADVIALLKGKGLELTEENIKAEITKHPEWKKKEEPTPGAKEFGANGGKKDPGAPDEKEQARKLFGL